MGKNKSKNGALRMVSVTATDHGLHAVGNDWNTLEAEFFARESDLYVTAPIDTFDDLDD